MRAVIEVADIFRAAGPAYRAARAGHLSEGLALILDETRTAYLEYDPSLVRYFVAVLMTAMAQRDRGDPSVQSAWSDAIDADPLSDIRRAGGRALEKLEGTTLPGEGAGE